MAFEDKKGIIVASPFKLQAEALLDVRQQVDTIAERDRLVTLKAATAGLRVFVKENSTSYVYTGSKWDPLATGAPYKHPTGDGNHHVPATGTTNAGKYLKAGATAGSEAWSNIAASDITGLPTRLPNPQVLKFTGAATATYDGSGAVTVNIPTSGTTDASLTLQMNGGTTEGTNKFTFNGSAAKTVNITPELIGAAAASHTHPASQITGLPIKLPNPYALKFTGAATATYDGSGAVTVNIPTAQASPYALIMQFNGGTTEDTNKFTFNAGSAKTVNITPAAIGAAAASHSHSGYAPTNHTHNYAGSGSAGGSANSAVKLATARTINGISFDGTKNIEIPNSYSKQLTSEDLNTLLTPGNYFAAGGNTVKNKPSSVDNFGLEVYKTAADHIAQKLHGSNNIIYYRRHDGTSFNSWSEIYSSVNKPTPSEIGAAAASHTHNYAASSHTHPASQITGLPTSLKNPYALTVKTNGTEAATYDGSAAKEVNITPATIGAAAASHSHSGYAPTSHTHKIANITDIADAAVASAGGVRDSSNNAKITISYQETSATTFSYIPVFTGATHIGNISKANFRSVIDAAPASHTHNYAGSSSAGGPANSAKKVDVPVGTVMWSTSSSSTFFAATMGGTWEVVGNIDAIINTSTSITFYLHKKKAL